MSISSCCSFGNKWAHSKHHWCSTPMCCCLALSLEGSLQVQKLRQERTSFVQGCGLSLEDSEVQQTDKPRQSSSPPWRFQCFHLSSVNQLLPSKPSSQQGRTAAMFLLISWAGLLASGVTLWVWYTSMESPNRPQWDCIAKRWSYGHNMVVPRCQLANFEKHWKTLCANFKL